jgi:hypothetical protein
MSELWRALLQGVGWRLGKEAAEDAIATLKRKVDGEPEAEAPKESPEAMKKRIEREAREAEKARVAARKAAEKRAKEVEREVDRELRALKEKVAREPKR